MRERDGIWLRWIAPTLHFSTASLDNIPHIGKSAAGFTELSASIARAVEQAVAVLAGA
jgi:hypothetical protein